MTCTPALRWIASTLLLLILSGSAYTVWLWACGPDIVEVPLLARVTPAQLDRYADGRIGIVRPTFARRYLVQAFRVFSGLPALDNIADGAISFDPVTPFEPPARAGLPSQPSPGWRWNTEARRFGATTGYQIADRETPGGYAYFLNCPDDAFETALETLAERSATFGRDSAEVHAWGRGQVAVFANCSGDELVLPPPPATTHPLILADHAYQTAAAYFYAMRFEDAIERFRRIAAAGDSPWQRYGRYLAARATIRMATLRDLDDAAAAALLTDAESQLRSVLSDARAASLHASTRGLLEYIAGRRSPDDRRRELARQLRTSPTASAQQIHDYKFLLDKIVGDTVDYEFNAALAADPALADDPLTDWVITTQATGEAALTRSLARWRATPSPAWLVSVLWKLPPDHAAAASALAAAARIDAGSPAFPTIAFLRARLLIARGARDEARAVLAALPAEPAGGFDCEAINLVRALRFRVAATLDELLVNAQRIPLGRAQVDPDVPAGPTVAMFDEDAARLFTDRMPLTRLLDASRAPALAPRLRARLAAAALARAIVLRQHAAGRDAARLLLEGGAAQGGDTAPPPVDEATRSNLQAYLAAATTVDQHRAGVLLLARSPRLHAFVRGIEDNWTFNGLAGYPPSRSSISGDFSHTVRDNWWCIADGRIRPQYDFDRYGVLDLLPAGADDPPFLSPNDRQSAAREIAALVAAGDAQQFVADEAVAWARAARTDLGAAEALAHAVEGGRWSCSVPASSKRAFETLHRIFPGSEWARRTKYWYAGPY